MTNESYRAGLIGYLSWIELDDRAAQIAAVGGAANAAYASRNRAIVGAMMCAIQLNYAVGFRIDPNEPEWPVAFIELPTGQVSWHLPQHERVWDGHSTEEKYRRIREFCGAPEPPPDGPKFGEVVYG